jgi:hypothetical protein
MKMNIFNLNIILVIRTTQGQKWSGLASFEPRCGNVCDDFLVLSVSDLKHCKTLTKVFYCPRVR